MRLQDVTERPLIVELSCDRRTDALRELVELVGRSRRWRPLQVQTCLWEVLRRHALMPSGLGRGLAFPSARLADLARPALAVGLARHGLDFQSADRTATHVILLYLGRPSPPPDELAMLERLSPLLRSDKVAALLTEAAGPDGLWQALQIIDSVYMDAKDGALKGDEDEIHRSSDCVHPQG